MDLLLNNITNYLYQRKRFVVGFFIIFFMVGFAGLVIPISHPVFLKLFPLALLLSFVGLLLFHQPPYDTKMVIVLLIIGLLGFFIEVAGVKTHVIFGHYTYGKSLGIQFLNTPLLIGVNWVMLTFASSSIMENRPLPLSLKIIFASLIMLLYDIVLEQIAPRLDMWYWAKGVVPFQNYLAWFVIALLFQSLVKLMGIKTRNSLACTILLCQATFFTALIIYFRFTP